MVIPLGFVLLNISLRNTHFKAIGNCITTQHCSRQEVYWLAFEKSKWDKKKP